MENFTIRKLMKNPCIYHAKILSYFCTVSVPDEKNYLCLGNSQEKSLTNMQMVLEVACLA